MQDSKAVNLFSKKKSGQQSNPIINIQSKPSQNNTKRTQSDVSLDGNTIDMVRIVKKNQQSRKSKNNVRRKQYQKFYYPSAQDVRIKNRTSAGPLFEDKDLWQDQSKVRISSIIGHKNTTNDIKDNTLQFNRTSSYFLIEDSPPKNKFIGIFILILFFLFITCEIWVKAYFLNVTRLYQASEMFQEQIQGRAIMDGYGFMDFERSNLLTVLIIYLISESMYHLFIIYIDYYSQGVYKLIDKQTSRLRYILRCRDQKYEHTQFQKITKSPYFTIFLFVISTLFYCCGISYTYYYNEMNFAFSDKLDHRVIWLSQLFYFTIILPETVKYIFFERMHILAPPKDPNDHSILTISSVSENYAISEYFKNPLTTFDTEKWWSKLAIIVIFVSIIYSISTSLWLIIISFSRIQILFKRTKYRIDSFYIQQFTKLILLAACALLYYFKNERETAQTKIYAVNAMGYIFIFIIAMMLKRVLANVYLKNLLYKYFYNEMHFNFGMAIFICLELIIFTSLFENLAFWESNTMWIIFFSICSIISIYTEGYERQLVIFDANEERKSDYHVEMENF